MKYDVVIGGTGSLGERIVDYLYSHNKNVIVYSRDELKQSELKQRYSSVQMVIGDIRYSDNLADVLRKAQNVFHCAALKQVDVGENHVHEFLMTNYLGLKRAYDYSNKYGVDNFVFFTTDKAVMPINAYGMTKALAEKYLDQQRPQHTNISIYRWGNILGSRGSVINHFSRLLDLEKTIGITHPDMCRFWLDVDAAVRFVMGTYHKALPNPRIPAMKCANVLELADAVAQVKGKKMKFKITGVRPGEKIHEVMETQLGFGGLSTETAERYSKSELIELVREYMGKIR